MKLALTLAVLGPCGTQVILRSVFRPGSKEPNSSLVVNLLWLSQPWTRVRPVGLSVSLVSTPAKRAFSLVGFLALMLNLVPLAATVLRTIFAGVPWKKSLFSRSLMSLEISPKNGGDIVTV